MSDDEVARARPEPEREEVQRRLATVQLLLSTPRTATAHDILIATAVESLRNGPKSDDELFQFAKSVWPGAGITELQMDLALQSAEAARLIEQGDQLDGSQSWVMKDVTKFDLEASDGWARSVVDRCEDFLITRGIEAFGELDRTTAHLWIGILEDALFAGIRDSFAKAEQGVRVVGAKTFAPQSYDLLLMQGIIDERCTTDEVNTFMKGMLFEALDPSNPFGSELVHTIATGYVLHLFLSRRDLIDDRTEVGTLRGQTIFFDTPILLRLLGPNRDSEIVWRTITATVGQGVHMVVHKESLDELETLLSRATGDARDIESDLAKGSSADFLAEIVSSRPIQLWLEKKAEGELDTWQEFCDQIDGIVSRLLRHGAIQTNPRTGYSLAQTSQFEELRVALDEEMQSARGEAQIRHDASLLLDALEKRQAFTGGGLWPGAAILTPDTHLAPVFRSVRGEGPDSFPIAVTLSQWIGVITSCADPAAAEDLARAVSSEIAYETLLSIAVRFPVESSRALAQVLANGHADSSTDMHVAQMTIDDLLNEQPDFAADPISAANQVATVVLAERGRRMGLATAAQREFASEERRRAETEAATSRALAKREQEARVQAEASSLAERRRANTAEEDLGRAKLRSKRMPIIYVLMTIGGLLTIAFGIVGLWGFFLGTFLAVLILWRQGDEWATDKDKSWKHLLTALVPEVLGTYDLFRH